jgi:cysteine desulfurase
MAGIYLDYNASTPIEAAVAAVTRSWLHTGYGNPSSRHWASVPAKTALEEARSQVAQLICCARDEVVFTSGGSEANNLALKGTSSARRAIVMLSDALSNWTRHRLGWMMIVA